MPPPEEAPDADLTIVMPAGGMPPEEAPDADTQSVLQLEEFYSRGHKFAAGGQAEIYSGTDLNLQREVAIKSLRREFHSSPSHRKAFLEEARITARLEHPAIVPVHAVMSDSRNGLHMAMKIIHGQSLKSLLEELRSGYAANGFSVSAERSSLSRRLDIFLRICDALEYAHSRNIMHCDLKPENIMTGEYHGAYLMDWGLSHPIKDPDSGAGRWQAPKQIAGTLRFISPEALRGERCDHRADIYSMGLILFELLTLTPAYSGNDTELIDKIRRGEHHEFRHLYGFRISDDLKAVALKAAALHREERYNSIGEMADDIRRWQRGEAVSARPDSIFSRIARWSNLHRRAVLIFALSVLLVGTAGTAYSLYRQIFFERQSHIRQLALNEAGANNSMTALSIDRQLTKFELSLMTAAREVLFLLNNQVVLGHQPVFSAGKNDVHGNFPAAGDDGSKADTLFWHTAPGSTPGDAGSKIQNMSILRQRLMRIILESDPGAALNGEDIAVIRQRRGKVRVPISRVFFGFGDGLFISYPGDGRQPAGFDHRNEFWFHKKVVSGVPLVAWSRPYRSIFGDDVISLTTPLTDVSGRLHGTAGISLSAAVMLHNLNTSGNSGKAVLSKSLVDSNGDLLLDTDPDFRKRIRHNYTRHKGKIRILRYRYDSLLPEFKRQGSGIIFRRERGRKVAFVFTRLAVENWFYVEKFDLDILTSSYGERNAESIAEGRKRPERRKDADGDDEL